jgi:transcriptional regulator with XRE-family HTH domain
MQKDQGSLGKHIKYWRSVRGLSQMQLAERAETSARHLSFIETGRSHPSVEILLRLADELDIPLRSRNSLLETAGYAPLYRETGLTSPEMTQVRKTLEFILKATEPYPAMLIDRYWNVLHANPPMQYLCSTFIEDTEFFNPNEFNLMRLILHPRGLQSVIQNYSEFEVFMVNRVRRMVNMDSSDQKMKQLLEEITHYESSSSEDRSSSANPLPQIIMPIHLKNDEHDIKMFTTIATLGAPQDITLQELRIETAFPVDEETDRFFTVKEYNDQ